VIALVPSLPLGTTSCVAAGRWVAFTFSDYLVAAVDAAQSPNRIPWRAQS